MELYPHQQTALEETRQYSRVAYYLDMGLGKTFVGSEKMRELNSPVNLIVCQKSKVEDWEKHMIEYLDYVLFLHLGDIGNNFKNYNL